MKVVYYLLLLLLGWGCAGKETKEKVPVVRLEKAEAGGSLKMSEILDNVRVIKLETRPEVLLPGFFFAWIGDRYIVVLGNEEIHLFTADGKYIRKLAQHGRGPEEYLYVLTFCVDEEKGVLYLSDGNNSIAVIGLEEGRVLGKLPAIGGSPHALQLAKDGSLVYIPLLTLKDERHFDFCRIKPDGTFIQGFSGIREESEPGTPYLGQIGGDICYKLSINDTLFMVKDSVRVPYCRLVTDLPYSTRTGEGGTVGIEFENKDYFVLADLQTEMKTEGEMVFTSIGFQGFYKLSKSDFKLEKISDFYIDLLDYTMEERFPFLVSGKRAYRNLNVSRFKEILKDKLDSPAIAGYLKTLYRELGEDDNPVLLVGDIKE